MKTTIERLNDGVPPSSRFPKKLRGLRSEAKAETEAIALREKLGPDFRVFIAGCWTGKSWSVGYVRTPEARKRYLDAQAALYTARTGYDVLGRKVA